MASLRSKYQDIGRQFIDLDGLPGHPAIIAVLLGGSSIYSAVDGRDERNASDWDGVIVVDKKLSIFHLVNAQRQSLMATLGIVREEHPELKVPNPLSYRWEQFDAVRFAGFDQLGIKRSVKILSADYFLKPNLTFNILSFKDKRVFVAHRALDTRYYLVQQVSRIEDGLFILHDQWVYAAPATVCDHGYETSFAAFGVTADLLVSGVWIHGHNPYGRQIQHQLLSNYSSLSHKYITAQSFSRYNRFSSEFTTWLTRELSELHLLFDIPSKPLHCHCPSTEKPFLYGDMSTAFANASLGYPSQSVSLSSDLVELYSQGKALSRNRRPGSVFASNSTTAEITLLAKTSRIKATKIFAKRSQYQKQELEGAMNAAESCIRVQLPYITSSGEMLYPFFEGKTESELRLTFINSGQNDWDAAEAVLYAELVKAEDMLRVYKKRLTDSNWCHKNTAGQPIHRFFHSRLVDNARFREFYGDSLHVGGNNLSMEEVLKIPWRVNEVVYPSLGELFHTSMDIVHPSSPQCTSCPIVFGLGDAHGANIMIASDVSPNNSREILYVDYEVAGFHPVMLDLAKPLFVDVFFDTLYMEVLPEVPEIECGFNGEIIDVHFTPCVNDLTQAVFDIKRRYLLEPLLGLVSSMGGDLEKNIPLLSKALFLCATLTRDHGKSQNAFIRNMATGIVLSAAEDLKGLYSCFMALGLET